MRLFRISLCLIALFQVSYLSSGQGTEKDELISSLASAPNDSVKVTILNRLSEELYASAQSEAIAYSDTAILLASKINYKEGEALAQKNKGLAQYFQDEYLEAYKSWDAALKLYEALEDKQGVANMLSNLGVVYDDQGDYSNAIDYYLQSLKIASEIKDTLREIAVLNNLGLIYSKRVDTEELALDNYLQALELSELKNYEEGIGSASLNIGEYYLNKSDFSTAIEYFEKSMRAYKSVNSVYLPRAYIDIGKIYVALEDYRIALEYQEEAFQYAQNIDDRFEMVVALLALGETYLQMGEFDKAIEFTRQSIPLSKEIGTKNERLEALKNLSTIYSELQNYSKAYEYLVQSTQLRDSIYSEENQAQINKLRIQYELQEILIENKIKEVELENSIKKNRLLGLINVLFIFVFVLTGVFIFLLFRTIRQKRKANKILEEQNVLISGQKQEITDSIRYASRIQTAVLTPQDDLNQMLPDHFILYQPRDIVSGDFYWITEINERVLCVVADCTGHGVPGAFMSMLGVAFLNEIISRNPNIEANEMLNELRKHVINSLHQKGKLGGSQDGMDLAAVFIDKKRKEIQYAGANNPLFLFRDGELLEYKADKMPIGIHENARKSFTNHTFKFKSKDVVYTFSDGFPDQFGGPKGKKFMIKNFKTALSELHSKPMKDQKIALQKILDDWMTDVKQIDDIIVMGIRL